MAELKNKKVQLKIKLNDGQGKNGKPKYKNLVYKDIDASISDENLLNLGKKLAGLQKLEVEDIYKVQSEMVVE
ncbi:DUF1659 domain-containing protein [Peptostreptococcus canis]|uniref:DUF1659 domain-containing protein n=1 Tax=Peptostreptococcus canis TaxID=1159213 RepID=A0ABR6TL35_9FIRM|nr:DUF1659 domain-containing protein [Peptostreptococcus canis]MBC2576125.1 DUF1659 domain-containing protein [Peptostreptococcus canis]MBP1998342.1 hypothetical protein [Peptostreptococcus canis]